MYYPGDLPSLQAEILDHDNLLRITFAKLMDLLGIDTGDQWDTLCIAFISNSWWICIFQS